MATPSEEPDTDGRCQTAPDRRTRSLRRAAGVDYRAGEVDLEHPCRLVTTGPYTYSRNPMYAGWALVSLGAGLVADSGWLVVAVSAAAWRAHRDVLIEENQLAMSFNEAFNTYRARVPRYL